MKKVLFVRHGQSVNNAKKIYTGTIDAELSELGKQEAIETGELLKDKNITIILSSDLSRAYNTAVGIKSVIDGEDNIEIEKVPLLNTNDLGDIQGTPYKSSGLIYALENNVGESAQSLYNRAIKALEFIKSIETDEGILVVGHGSFICVMFAVHEGKTKEEFIEYRKNWSFKNGEIKEKII